MLHKYETHLHTSETSLCAHSTGAEMAHSFKDLGYTGIFVTDHLYSPTTVKMEDQPWEVLIERHCSGYEAAAAVGEAIGLDVFFAWEYSFHWAHFLTYGLTKEWLLDNPDLFSWNIIDYFDHVHADGGLVVHAHPFRERVEHIHLFPTKIDAVEVLNMGRDGVHNRYAHDFAVSYCLPQTAGSDIHVARPDNLAGVEIGRRLTGSLDYAEAVLAGETKNFGTYRDA
jgi:hypothetical protein